VRDNQPKHRQQRRAEQKLARRKASRKGLPAILIICEGRETEPNYIEGLCEHLGVNMAAVTIVPGDNATRPPDLVKRAQKLFTADGGYDRVYVVCDGDAGGLEQARALAARPLRNSAREVTTLRLIASDPCFEFWLLLHFEYSAASLTSAEAAARLRSRLPHYSKADPDVFERVRSGLDAACRNATRLHREHDVTGGASPSSDMPVLVEELKSLASAPRL
jgi:hypothetical protein